MYTEGYSYEIQNNKKEIIFYPASVYLNVAIVFNNASSLEIRPGILFAGEYFSGLEIGLFYRHQFSDQFFGNIGIVAHYNTSMAHGTSVYEEINSGIYYNLGVTIGFKLNENVNLIFSYYKTLDEYYGYNWVYGDYQKYERYLYSIIKFGFVFNL